MLELDSVFKTLAFIETMTLTFLSSLVFIVFYYVKFSAIRNNNGDRSLYNILQICSQKYYSYI